MKTSRFIDQAKALSDRNRVRALLALRDRELCVCRLIELLQLAPSTVSKHLSILRQAGLVEGRKEGRWMHYRLPDDRSGDAWQAIEWTFRALADTEADRNDRIRMESIMETDLEKLVQIYRK